MKELNNSYYEQPEEVKIDKEIKDDFDIWAYEQEVTCIDCKNCDVCW